MKVLFLTDAGPEVASAREWFHQMYDLLKDKKLKVSLNSFDYLDYDVIFILRPSLILIQRAISHSPKARIGIVNPDDLGFQDKTTKKQDLILKNVDFFVVMSLIWKDMILKYKKRVYRIPDYDFYDDKEVKYHKKKNNLIIGYHGNIFHYANDFFPNGSNALKRLSEKYNFTLKVLTNNVEQQPRINGVRTEFIEWNINSYKKHIESFDIGICPYFSDMKSYSDPFLYIRNPNRINSLLFYGIPSVASPIIENCHVLEHRKTVLFAVSEEAWYQGIEELIIKPSLRNSIGEEGRKLVENNYSPEVAISKFMNIIDCEKNQVGTLKKGISDEQIDKFKFKPNKMVSITSRLVRKLNSIFLKK